MADWVCDRCRSTNGPEATTCFSCGSAMNAGGSDGSSFLASSEPGAPALATATGPTVTSPAFEPVLPLGLGGLPGGILTGALAGALATAVWYAVVVITGWQVGLVAIAVGWLIGQGVMIGARGRVSMALVAASGLLALLALAVSEYLILFHFITQLMGTEGASLVQPIDFMVTIVIESLMADPLTLLFWVIALFQAVAIPYRALRPTD